MPKRLAGLIASVVLVAGLFLPALVCGQSTPPSSIIVKLVAGLSDEERVDVIATNGGVLRSSIPVLSLYVIDVADAELADTLARYQADPRVQRAEENKVRVSESLPGDPLYVNQWSLPKIAWDQVFGTVNPTGTANVAVLDTGVDALHPELAGKVVPGTSILDGGSGMVDPSGHGTWLAGIIAARTGGAAPDGIAGVGYDSVRIMPVTVLNANGEGLDSDVVTGVVWATEHGADVILMAFSNPGFSSALQEAIDYAWSRGVVLVASAGNNASSTPAFPAGDRGVMGVAASDPNDAQAYFSNEGQAVFIAAPGTDIPTIDTGDAYTVVSGTSAAAAHVAGLAAFMKAVDPTLPNGVIVFRIASTADPAGTQTQTGNGRINMARALASTATDSLQPAGAAPVGEGGPFVGPYLADAGAFSYSPAAQSLAATAGGASASFNQTVTAPARNGAFTATVKVAGTGANPIPATWISATPSSLSFSTGSTPPGNADAKTWAVNVTVPSSAAPGAYTANIQANASISGVGVGPGTALTVTVSAGDTTPPTVVSINRAGSDPTNAASVDFTVTFSEAVSGVDTGDFSLATTGGIAGASLTGVSGGPTVYTVTVNTGTGDGTLGLNVTDNDSITDAATNKLGGTGAVNGNFTGQVYTIDKTPPTVPGTPSGAPNPNNTGTQTVTWAASSDPSSGGVSSGLALYQLERSNNGGASFALIASPTTNSYTESSPLAEGSYLYRVRAKDNAGNFSGFSSNSTAMVVDKTSPTAPGTPSGAPNPNNTGTQTVTWAASSDPISGGVSSGVALYQLERSNNGGSFALIASPTTNSYTESSPLAEGSYLYRVRAMDNAGNLSDFSGNSAAVIVDKTPPVIDVTGFSDGAIYYTGGGPLPTLGCSSAVDPLSGGVASGVASASSSPSVVGGGLNGNGVGSITYRCSATDNAGNGGSDTRTLFVRYGGVSGIRQPINPDNSSVFSRGKAIPVKFQLAGDEYVGFVTSFWMLQRLQVGCTIGSFDAQYENVGSVTPSTVFRYDSAADQYIYNSDFRDKPAGTCWVVKVTLDDGFTTMTSAVFQLQK